MSTSSTNNKSQQIGARFPHSVVKDMENLLTMDETKAQFIVTAVRGEIVRRQMGGTAEDAIISAIETITHIREGAAKAQKELGKIIKMADKEIGE
ncbi:YlcI/YnfO family protein [Pectobacterium odoriferum]|uniref:YlcI/YnfO family protein n=1 Tax=Pectobacterium TaxID=122277 RepID=UPI0015F5B46D|nr:MULTISPECIES: YlcI/YnfO family protein [Pectobacterium]GKX42448.1 hypothetical protein SOASR015_14820 [Pectobacterium carotovorum subsp. carotovorum]MBA5601732.1 hypothetical protein [Pectobacterium aroidearum]MBN3059757.1 hypothetical protein [Pectobacterium versatile]MCA5931394.1 hypothetical protein [Pectobacterium versatile]MCA5948667.1 hypothetical protein [Pectobacterium versatile]